MPKDFARWRTVQHCFRPWKHTKLREQIHTRLREHLRQMEGGKRQATAGMIDRNLADVRPGDPAALQRIEEYDAECSMVKVWCAEMCDYVVDETV